jgi:hypothetical protein
MNLRLRRWGYEQLRSGKISGAAGGCEKSNMSSPNWVFTENTTFGTNFTPAFSAQSLQKTFVRALDR